MRRLITSLNKKPHVTIVCTTLKNLVNPIQNLIRITIFIEAKLLLIAADNI